MGEREEEAEDHDAHVNLYAELMAAFTMMDRGENTHEFDRRDVIREILDSRLSHMSTKFWEKDVKSQAENKGQLGFADLLEAVSTWLVVLTNKGVRRNQKQTARVNAVDTNQNGQNGQKGKGGSYAKKASSPASPQGSQSRATCSVCTTMHATEDCNILIQMTPDERVAVLKEKRCCFACLESGHVANRCPKYPEGERPTCVHCKRKHHSLMHGRTYPPRPAGSQHQPRADALPFRQRQTGENLGQQPNQGQIPVEGGENPAGGNV